jgi:plasmid segregation protein ParM
MENMKFKVANDNGNSEQDMFIGDVEIASPNVLARVAVLPNLDEVQVMDAVDDIHNNLIVTVDDETYYIGNYALKSGMVVRSLDVGFDNNKVDSNIVYINTLAHIAGEAVRRAYEDGSIWTDHVIGVSAEMATSLPVVAFSAEEADRFAHKFMDTDKEVFVHVGKEEFQVTVSFSFVKVIPEGVTASHAFTHRDMLFRDYNRMHTDDPLASADLKNLRILHVAIGEGTTEFPLTKGIIYNPNFIDGTKNGVGIAIDRVIEPFKRKFGLMALSRQDFSAIIRNENHRYHDVAMKMLRPALEDEADIILRRAEHNIQKANNEVDIVAVYGGGSILMREALEAPLKKFCDRAMIKLLYITNEKDAVLLESYGLRDFVMDKLFDNIARRAKKTA